ncbi:MAG: hypothetical protein Q4E59_00510 [Bacteroidales bacterium]|nr:hypothetical protein [Bacteroidales bacterium]
MRKFKFIMLMLLLFAGVAALFAVSPDDDFSGDSVRTPDYYETHVRSAFSSDRWEEGKRLLDEGLKTYPTVSGLNELAGRYYYYHKNYDDARFYLIKSLRDNNENVQAKQLLVNVEEETKNYSSAICYVNELLEVNPYWRGLWRRKINLYRLQGNDVEADRLLKRICQIYPDDEQLQNDYTERLDKEYQTQRKNNDKSGAVASLRELIKANPNREDYYLALSNLLLQQGLTEEAKEVAGRGAAVLPQSYALITKKAGILASEYRYPEALSYVKDCMARNRSAALSSFYNGLLLEAARAESQRDPYILYGKVYATQHSQEALDFLLNTAISRGYDEDALFYINEARQREGETPALLYKSYLVNKRLGNVNTANSLLLRLYDRNPANTDVADELARLRLEQATSLMSDGAYAEALPYLQFAAANSSEAETSQSAWNKILTCNSELRRYNAAAVALDTLHARFPDMVGYTARKATLLNHQGRTADALALLQYALADSLSETERFANVVAYEEIAVPYIKRLQENGAVRRAYDESVRLLDYLPASEQGLHYAVNTSARLGLDDAFAQYVAQGRNLYPDDNFYLVKQAEVYYNQEEYPRALDLLRPQLHDFLGDTTLVKSYSMNSEAQAYALLKRHQPNTALEVLDSALVYDSRNRSLLYAKGVVFESKHQYDSAYVYQSKYSPSIEEMASHRHHLNSLEARGFKNTLNFGYLQSRYGDDYTITSVANLSYSRQLGRRDILTGRVNYAGRDGDTDGDLADEQVPGGMDVQVQAEWEHTFSAHWRGMVNVAGAGKYFPQLMANLSATYTFDSGWEAEARVGYRRINSYKKAFEYDTTVYNEDTQSYGTWTFADWERTRQNLFNVGLGASTNVGDFALSGKADGFFLSGKVYVNVQAQAKYFPLNDGRTNVTALAGVGTAPEATLIDNALPGTFDKLNAVVGLGGQYMFNKHISLGVMGTWHTFYHQSNTRSGTDTDYSDYLVTRYKNLFNVDAQLYISF